MPDGTVVVAGRGLTGVESAAEIAEQHPELDVVLLSRQVPGSMMGDRARERLHTGLDRLGVGVRAGVDIVKVMADGVAHVHQPVSLGRNDAVIQFTHSDDSPGRFYLAGRLAVTYKETVSSSPWTTYRLIKALPAVGAATWRRGGRSTR